MAGFESKSSATILDPEARLKALIEHGNAVEVDFSVSPRRYYRSGLEMVRMASIYLKEGSLENAFILYMKFMTLFLEKIRSHPDLGTVPIADKAVNNQKLREVFPIAEKLKHRLLEHYHKEHERHIRDRAIREEQDKKKQKELLKEEQLARQKREEAHKPEPYDYSVSIGAWPSVVVPVPPLPADLSYPSDTVVTSKPKPDGLILPSGPRPELPENMAYPTTPVRTHTFTKAEKLAIISHYRKEAEQTGKKMMSILDISKLFVFGKREDFLSILSQRKGVFWEIASEDSSSTDILYKKSLSTVSSVTSLYTYSDSQRYSDPFSSTNIIREIVSELIAKVAGSLNVYTDTLVDQTELPKIKSQTSERKFYKRAVVENEEEEILNVDSKTLQSPVYLESQTEDPEIEKAEIYELHVKPEKLSNDDPIGEQSKTLDESELKENHEEKYEALPVELPEQREETHADVEMLSPEETFHEHTEDLSIVAKPGIDRSTKPVSLLSPSTHSRLGPRTLIIPSNVFTKFLTIAQNNTDKNLETCGLLTGKLQHDQLVVTHLIVPKQKGTSDNCHMENEEDVCMEVEKRELFTLGWIHTHPSQTAFLSSIDLHTQFGYQVMMPEAVAVVCAPTYDQNKTFWLTPNHGMEVIRDCSLTGFHPHPNDPPIFVEAEHCRLDSSVSITVIDLR